MYVLVVFSTFTTFCNHHHCLILEGFHQAKKILHYYLSFFILSFPQPVATTNILSVCIDLPILGISYLWNQTICSLLHLASLS